MSIARRAADDLLKMTSGHLATVLVLTLSGILIPRAFGLEAYGRYSAVLAVVAMLQAVSTLGLQQVGVRFLSPLWRRGPRSEAETLGSTIWMLRLALAPFVGLVGAVWLSRNLAAQSGLAVLLALGALCAFRSAQEATRGLFLPIGHVGKMAGFELLHVAVRLPIVLISYQRAGLPGVFFALCALQGALWLATSVSLLRVFPLRLQLFEASSLRPYLSYGLSSWLTAACNVFQVQLGIYAIAVWVAPREAGYLALAMQFYLLARGLYLPVQRSLMPILSEIDSAGESERLVRWGALLLQASIAVSCIAAIAWATLGKSVVLLLFGEAFAPAYPVAVVLFCGLILLTAGLACHLLLFVRRQAEIAALATVVHTVAVLGGLALVLQGGGSEGVAVRIAWVYLMASALFLVSTYTALRWRGGLRLPLSSSLLLTLPALLAIPASHWTIPWELKILALLGFVLAYGGFALHLGLLDIGELSEVLRRIRLRKSMGKGKNSRE